MECMYSTSTSRGQGFRGRVSGGRVSGGRVSGGRVSGGRVSAKLFVACHTYVFRCRVSFNPELQRCFFGGYSPS